jgi:hypothetical protein
LKINDPASDVDWRVVADYRLTPKTITGPSLPVIRVD